MIVLAVVLFLIAFIGKLRKLLLLRVCTLEDILYRKIAKLACVHSWFPLAVVFTLQVSSVLFLAEYPTGGLPCSGMRQFLRCGLLVADTSISGWNFVASAWLSV